MFVIKIGEYYIRDIGGAGNTEMTILLSKEIMRSFSQVTATKIAKLTNGEVIKVNEEVTND